MGTEGRGGESRIVFPTVLAKTSSDRCTRSTSRHTYSECLQLSNNSKDRGPHITGSALDFKLQKIRLRYITLTKR